MTDITQNNDTYPPAIYQIAVTDPVLGGAGGIANKAAAALADRTAYQRMRNVTPWVPGLDQPYPAHAYVQRSGLTYKSLVANANVDPATPAAVGIWERWAYTESEMYAFLKNNHGGNCPVTGPAAAPSAAAPWTMYTSVAPYLEVWMWVPVLGWKVISNLYADNSVQAAFVVASGATRVVKTWIAPRSGKAIVSTYSAPIALVAGHVYTHQITLNGVGISGDASNGPAVNSQLWLSPSITVDLSAGDVVAYTALTTNTVTCPIRTGMQYTT